MTEPQRPNARPPSPTPASVAELGLGPCRCGQPALVEVGGPRSEKRPLCIRCFGGLLRVARSLGDLARDAGVVVVVNVSIDIDAAADKPPAPTEFRRFAG